MPGSIVWRDVRRCLVAAWLGPAARGRRGPGFAVLGQRLPGGWLLKLRVHIHIHAHILTQARGGGGGERGPLVAAAASYGGQHAAVAAAAAAAPSFLIILYILDSKEKEGREGK